VDFLQDLLKDKAGDMIAELTGKAGFEADAAEKFVPEAGKATVDALKANAGSLDLENLASAANVSSLIGGMDIGSLASKVGISTDKASGGLTAMLPMMLKFVGARSQGAGGLVGLLGLAGGLGGLGGAADKLKDLGGGMFGK